MGNDRLDLNLEETSAKSVLSADILLVRELDGVDQLIV